MTMTGDESEAALAQRPPRFVPCLAFCLSDGD